MTVFLQAVSPLANFELALVLTNGESQFGKAK